MIANHTPDSIRKGILKHRSVVYFEYEITDAFRTIRQQTHWAKSLTVAIDRVEGNIVDLGQHKVYPYSFSFSVRKEQKDLWVTVEDAVLSHAARSINLGEIKLGAFCLDIEIDYISISLEFISGTNCTVISSNHLQN